MTGSSKLKRQQKVWAAAILLPAMLTLGGCVIVTEGDGHWRDGGSQQADWQERERENRAAIAAFAAEVSIEHVRETLGTADFSDSLSKDGKHYQVLYYRTHRVDGDGKTTRDECTPLVFVDGALVGTGNLALSSLN